MVQLAPKQKIIEFLNKEFSKIKAQRLQQGPVLRTSPFAAT